MVVKTKEWIVATQTTEEALVEDFIKSLTIE